MPKVLIATEKPFAAEAVQKIKAELDKAGYPHSWLENYTDVKDFHAAVADAEASSSAATKWMPPSSTPPNNLK